MAKLVLHSVTPNFLRLSITTSLALVSLLTSRNLSVWSALNSLTQDSWDCAWEWHPPFYPPTLSQAHSAGYSSLEGFLINPDTFPWSCLLSSSCLLPWMPESWTSHSPGKVRVQWMSKRYIKNEGRPPAGESVWLWYMRREWEWKSQIPKKMTKGYPGHLHFSRLQSWFKAAQQLHHVRVKLKVSDMDHFKWLFTCKRGHETVRLPNGHPRPVNITEEFYPEQAIPRDSIPQVSALT